MELLSIIIDALDNPSIDKPENAGLFWIVEHFFGIYFVVEAAKDFDKNRPEYERKAMQMIQKTGLPRS